ncbi:MAG: ChbG/HpnK family deacetylase [Candidatus Omnitrophica bacterium]|nr:ChbG/HpnK family deacetylase [Candidatus Omnitrophota bacterium]
MKKLIINADDLGVSDAVNEAAESCLKSAVITGVSVMPCGRRFREAAAMLRNMGFVEAGIHLTLTGGLKPISGGADSLRSSDGHFPANYMHLARLSLTGRVKVRHVRDEFTAQIEALRNEGLKITHIDGHEHVHMLPGILRCVIDLAKEHGIKYIRIPLERSSYLLEGAYAVDIFRHAVLKPLAATALKEVKKAGLFSNSHFLGHIHSGRINENVLALMLGRMEEGVNEIAFHPAVFTKGLLGCTPRQADSARELKTLLESGWRKRAEELGIRPVTHKEASS